MEMTTVFGKIQTIDKKTNNEFGCPLSCVKSYNNCNQYKPISFCNKLITKLICISSNFYQNTDHVRANILLLYSICKFYYLPHCYVLGYSLLFLYSILKTR